MVEANSAHAASIRWGLGRAEPVDGDLGTARSASVPQGRLGVSQSRIVRFAQVMAAFDPQMVNEEATDELAALGVDEEDIRAMQRDRR